MTDMTAHDQRKSSDLGRPQDVGIAGGFGSSFDNPLVDRSQLIQVIALVRTAPGIQERKHAGDQQAGFMHGDCIGTGKDSAGLSVFTLTVTEKQRVVCRKQMSQMAGLTDETADQSGSVADAGPGGNNEVFCHDVVANKNRCGSIAVDAAVFQPGSPFDTGIVADTDIADGSGVDDLYVMADFSGGGCYLFAISFDQVFQFFRQHRIMAVQGDDIGQMSRQLIEYRDLPAAGFIQYGHQRSVAESGAASRYQQIDILDDAIVSDFVIGDMVGNIFNQHIVAQAAIVECDIAQTCLFGQATFQDKFMVERTEFNVARKTGVPDVIGFESGGYFYALPIGRLTALLF